MTEFRERILSWTTDSRPPGKHVRPHLLRLQAHLTRHCPKRLLQAAASLPPLPRRFAGEGRSTRALSAAAALALGTAVMGTAHAAQEPTSLQRTTVVSELSPEAPAEPEKTEPERSDREQTDREQAGPEPAESGEGPSDGQGSTTPVDDPGAPEPGPPVSVPLDELRVTSPYGWRENPLLSAGVLEFHTGIDFGAVTGTPVKAAAPGTVTYAEYHQYGGLRIVVDHGDGTETTYNHLNDIHVAVGQRVDFNEVIGGVGSTGNSTGPHLHFEVLRNGDYADPAQWLGI